MFWVSGIRWAGGVRGVVVLEERERVEREIGDEVGMAMRMGRGFGFRGWERRSREEDYRSGREKMKKRDKT